jgi:hypothetical protein
MAGQFFLDRVSLSAKSIDFSQHPFEEEFGGGGGNTRALKLKDFLAMTPQLGAHVFNLGPDELDTWHFPPPRNGSAHREQKENQIQAARTWYSGVKTY